MQTDRTYYSFLALCLLVFIAPILAPTYYGPGPIAPDLYKALWLQSGSFVVFAFSILVAIKNNTYKISLNSWQLGWVLLLLWASISLFWVLHFNLAVIALSRWLVAGFLFIIACQLITSKERAEIIIGFIWGAAIIITLIGLSQHFELLNKKIFLQAVPPAATFGNRNMAMHFIILALPLNLWFFSRSKQPWQTFIVAIVTALMISYVFHSSNRTSFLALILEIIALVCFIVWMRRKKTNLVMPINYKSSIVVALLFFALLINLNADGWNFIGMDFYHRYLNFENYMPSAENSSLTSFQARLDLYYNSFFMIRDHFFTGVGFGNWTVYYPYYTGNFELMSHMSASYPNSTILYKQTHNEYIQLFSELGVIGLLLAVLLVSFWIKGFSQLLKNHFDHEHSWLWICLAIGVIGVSVNTASSFTFRVSIPLMVIAIYLAVIYFYYHNLVLTSTEKSSLKDWFTGKGKYTFSVVAPVAWGVVLLCVALFFVVFNTYSTWMEAHKLRNISAGYLMAGKYNHALKKIKESLKINPADPDDGYYILGNIYKTLKLYTQAIQTYEKAFAISLPYHPYMYTQLHVAHLLNKDTANAIKTMQRAIKLMPKQDGYYAYLGSVYASVGEFDKAIKNYRKTLALNPYHPHASKIKNIIRTFNATKQKKTLNNNKVIK